MQLDELLRSAADSLGARTLAVVLTGMGRDGARGALAVKRAGGTVIVQRADALLQLPAIAVVRADHTTSGVICYTRGGVRPVISAPEAGSGPDWHPLRGLASHAAPLRPHPTPRHASTPNGRYPNA